MEQTFDAIDVSYTEILSAIAQYSLVTKPVQNRADHGPGRTDQIREFLLSDPQMLAKPMSAPPVESTGELPQRLSQPRFSALECYTGQSTLQLPLTIGIGLDQPHTDGRHSYEECMPFLCGDLPQ